jgi:hypothetical protein
MTTRNARKALAVTSTVRAFAIEYRLIYRGPCDNYGNECVYLRARLGCTADEAFLLVAQLAAEAE